MADDLRFDPQTGKLKKTGAGGGNLPQGGGGGRSSASNNFRRFWKSGLVGLVCSGIGGATDVDLFFVATLILWAIAGFSLVRAVWLWIFD